MSIEITVIPVLEDNYAYLIESSCGAVGVLDPGEAAPVIDLLKARGLRLDYVLNTHHHGDHIAGNQALIKAYGAKLVAPAKENNRIRGIDVALKDMEVFDLGRAQANIIETPGHTKGGICFYFAEDDVLFSGDTLFALGCGRLFEGTPADMYRSLGKLKALPDETMVYCGHEYSAHNADFCLQIAPDNEALQERAKIIKAKREALEPTIPFSLGEEMKTSPFMMAGSVKEFAVLRAQRDEF